MQHALLNIQNLSVDFVSDNRVHQAVKGVSLHVNRGEIVAIVGESGSGKSVTSLSILQLLPSPPAKISQGKIFFSEDGNDFSDLLQKIPKELQSIRGNKIAMIFQEPMTSLNPVYTCGNQVMEALLTHKNVSKLEAKHQAILWFEKVKLPNPNEIFDRYPHQLSGGQKQRVMIAMAMCCEPALLICDEPTTALDVTVQRTILQLIKELQQESNMGVIFITHDLGVVAEIADRAVVMYKGDIVEQGMVKEIFLTPKNPYTKALIACRPANNKKGERLLVVNDFLFEKDNQIADKSIAEAQINTEHKVLIDINNLSVWFPNKTNWLGKPVSYLKAVDNISFQVYENETLGIVGESGCGKTTLGRALLRLIIPTKGTISYLGKDITLMEKEDFRTLRKNLQIIFQDPYSSLNPRKKIGEAIAEPMKVHAIFGSDTEIKNEVLNMLEKVGLTAEHYDRYPHEFSGGQRQRIVIARALALKPSFLICDESVSALDVSVQAQVLNLLNDLKKEFGFTIVFISHDLSVVKYFSDSIIVMNKGKIEETGNAIDIYENPQQLYTKNLIASIPKGLIAQEG